MHSVRLTLLALFTPVLAFVILLIGLWSPAPGADAAAGGVEATPSPVFAIYLPLAANAPQAGTPGPTTVATAMPTDMPTEMPTDMPTEVATVTPTPTPTTTPEAGGAAVTLQGISFVPQTVTIQVGQTVTWTRVSGFHNVLADDGSFGNTPSVSWDVFTHTFTAPSVVPYHCQVHGAAGGVGMWGAVVVVQ